MLALLVFWLDLVTPLGVAIPSLHVAPVLLFLWGGVYWEALVAAVLVSILAIVGMLLSPEGSLALAQINRPLEMTVVWLAAILVTNYRLTIQRWTTESEQDARVVGESLKRLEEMRYALDQAAIVAATDHRGLITFVNDKFCEISKYTREELIGQDHRIINSGYHPKEFIRDLWRTIARGQVWRGELRNRAKDGSPYWVDTTIVPFLDERGKPRQYLAIRSDITARKQAEAQLSAQAALTQLGQLAAVVAHEVRNPLAGLRASIEVLRSRLPASQKEREVLQAMIERIDSLSAKVDDILRFAKPRTPIVRPIELSTILVDAVASARAAVKAECPEIRFTPEPRTVLADAEMLRAALLNLLLNACQAGGTFVEIEADDDGERCRVRVLDRGAGIPEDVGERVFDPFFTTKKTGTGLGLPIVKRLLELQDGTVALSRRDGGGTVAEISVPSARAANQPAARPAPTGAAG